MGKCYTKQSYNQFIFKRTLLLAYSQVHNHVITSTNELGKVDHLCTDVSKAPDRLEETAWTNEEVIIKFWD